MFVWLWNTLRDELKGASTWELIALTTLCVIAFHLLAQLLDERAKAKAIAELPPYEPPKKIVPRPYTWDEVSKCTGTGDEKRIWICVRNKIYDMSSKPSFYGPDGPYSAFAGRDATRALALTSTDKEHLDNPQIDDISDLTALNEWIAMFEGKYDVVGWIGTAEEVKQWQAEQRPAEQQKTRSGTKR